MKTRSILLVEDNPSDIALTERALKRSRITNPLHVVEDGQQALDYLFGLSAEQLPIVILLDLHLPKIDGLEVLQRVRENKTTRRLPVIILTSSGERLDVGGAYDLGVNSYIRKPVDLEQFSKAIEVLGLYWLVLNEPPPAG